ncbi:hypothetical protein [Nostoc sp. WHI]|uniref:hypothetical protein n=1 Tax=Nostoc sp. WHI TaxID=2650611 RepID=UPI0018C4EADF|nr:hypothetical protein [Nostoc sp. WHI]MBG1266131.1 hypothetical protein [Nostoc sp. WHI]
MKSYFIALVVVISALAVTQSAYANQENIPIPTGDVYDGLRLRNQAEVLLTEPATITTTWSNFVGQTNNRKQAAESLSAVQEGGCKNINPLEIINNPGAFFKQCQKPTNTQSSQSSEPIEYFKVPKLDSGISVTVTKF